MDKIYKVYKITNNINKNVYFGYTSKSVIERFKKHALNAAHGIDSYLYRAIRKHGITNFSCIQLKSFTNKKEALECEKKLIMEYSDTNTLYNISSGGTGGFVVPKDKMNKWKESIKVRTQHSDNPNFSGFSDQELVDIACEYFKSIGYIAGSKVWARFAKENGYPQTFSKNRFGGKYDNFAKRVQEKTNLTYAKHRKSEDHKQKLRECSKSKAWVTDGSISKYINKNELDLYIKKGFRRGRHA